jgi:mRNA interferase MazF
MTNSLPETGDIVLIDLGMVAKVRPCLILCGAPDSQRTVSIFAPITTEIRGGESEVAFPKPAWLKEKCVVNLSGLGSVERRRIERHLGQFPADRLLEVKSKLTQLFGLPKPPA